MSGHTEPYIDKRTLSATLGLGVRTINRRMTEGLPHHKWGKLVRFRVSEVVEFLDSQTRQQL